MYMWRIIDCLPNEINKKGLSATCSNNNDSNDNNSNNSNSNNDNNNNI